MIERYVHSSAINEHGRMVRHVDLFRLLLRRLWWSGWLCILGTSTSAVCTAKLHLSNGYPVASFQLAAHTATMSSAVLCTSSCDLFASFVCALLAPTMLHTELRRGLCGLVASRHRAPATATVSCTEIGTSNSRFGAPFLRASLSSTVGSAEELVASTLVATRECTTASTTVGNTETRRTLCALRTAFFLAYAVAAVLSTVWATRDC